ncbi:hypothetical protein [Neisseria zalophi]|uniref:Uncharacterized protein n=1 Tax=Neisseria zalophi TaxID=640030 RepID=A0A5J6PTC2_9NEIS|nr:hypothetical protein [Neisseria zalophi]QEY25775.1 hypothetical protein D0T92_03960 [Neisseria zalophi]
MTKSNQVSVSKALPSNSINKFWYMLPVLMFGLLFAIDAQAAGGGLSKLTAEGKEWDKAIYGFIGVCATIFLLFKGVQIWANKGSWGDFGEACLKVIVVAAVPTLATYLWSLYGS